MRRTSASVDSCVNARAASKSAAAGARSPRRGASQARPISSCTRAGGGMGQARAWWISTLLRSKSASRSAQVARSASTSPFPVSSLAASKSCRARSSSGRPVFDSPLRQAQMPRKWVRRGCASRTWVGKARIQPASVSNKPWCNSCRPARSMAWVACSHIPDAR